MKDTRLLQIFQSVKDTICKYDYYIHTSKKIIHLSNTEDKIPHLMGLQYAGRPKQYTGDLGAYAVIKGRITMQSLEKLVLHCINNGELNCKRYSCICPFERMCRKVILFYKTADTFF